MTVANWSERVKPFLNSRHLSALVVLVALLFNGGAIFFFNDVAKKIPFWSNALVWYGLIHSVLMLLLALLMALRLWQWRMEQLALFGGFFAFSILNLLLCTYIGIATYSSASLIVKLLLWLVLLGYQGWFAFGIHRAYRKAWTESSLRDLMLVEMDDHFLFFQQGEIKVREKIGFKAHCNPLIMIVFMVAGFATYFIRKPLTDYFDVNWVPIAYAIMALPLATLGTSLLMISWQYFIYPYRLTKQTGKIVYLDDMTKPTAK